MDWFQRRKLFTELRRTTAALKAETNSLIQGGTEQKSKKVALEVQIKELNRDVEVMYPVHSLWPVTLGYVTDVFCLLCSARQIALHPCGPSLRSSKRPSRTGETSIDAGGMRFSRNMRGSEEGYWLIYSRERARTSLRHYKLNER